MPCIGIHQAIYNLCIPQTILYGHQQGDMTIFINDHSLQSFKNEKYSLLMLYVSEKLLLLLFILLRIFKL